jgi:hypothetical protein
MTGDCASDGEIVETKSRQGISVSVQFGRLAKSSERSVEIIRQWRAKIQLLARNRVVELKPCRMQEVAPGRKRREPPPTTTTVHVIPHNRVTDRREMDPYLVRSSGVEMGPEQLGTGEASEPVKIRARTLPCSDDCHTLPVSRIARDWLVHG